MPWPSLFPCKLNIVWRGRVAIQLRYIHQMVIFQEAPSKELWNQCKSQKGESQPCTDWSPRTIVWRLRAALSWKRSPWRGERWRAYKSKYILLHVIYEGEMWFVIWRMAIGHCLMPIPCQSLHSESLHEWEVFCFMVSCLLDVRQQCPKERKKIIVWWK